MTTPKKTGNKATGKKGIIDAVIETLAPQEQQQATLNLQLTDARHKAVAGIAGGYGATREYGKVLNDIFPKQAGAIAHWFDVEHTFKDDFSNAVNKEKGEFYKELREAMKNNEGETNPSVYWKRIRTAGREERLGKPVTPSAELVEGSENEVNEGASGVEGSARSPNLRYIEELTRLYKFGERTENLPAKVAEAHKFVIKGLEALGVQVNMIETK